jgi:hypothetical protein
MLRTPEHVLKAFLLFDMSSGNVKSSLTFNGQFTSAGPMNFTYGRGMDYPYQQYSELITGPGAVAVAGTSGRGGLPNWWNEYHAIGLSTNDSWSVFARYLITVPIYRKLAWMMTIHIDNPFNHKGKATLVGTNDSGFSKYNVNPDLWVGNSGVDQSNGVWRATGNFNGWYRERQPGRAIYINTGIRF